MVNLRSWRKGGGEDLPPRPSPWIYRTRESWARVTTSDDRELREAFRLLLGKS